MPIDKRELLAALKDPQIVNFLRNQAIQFASSTSVGRFPGQGSAENDNWIYRDACDATHPFNADYVIPKNFQRIIAAKLSFILRPYRTYSSLALSTTGNTTPTADGNGGETGHSHSHAHTIPITFQAGIGSADTVFWQGAGNPLQTTGSGPASGNTSAINSDGTGSSGHNHGTHTHGAHNHTVSGTTTLGIAEDVSPSNPGITITFDGTDRTAALGGPFNASMIEVDVTQFLPTATGVQHTVALQPNQRATITGILRISYAVDSRLAQ